MTCRSVDTDSRPEMGDPGRLKHILILQNKIDLIKEEAAKEQHKQILKFIEGTVAEGAPIIPIFAQLKYNIEVVCEDIRYHQENPRASQRLHQ